MRNLKLPLPPIKATGNKRHFRTTTKYYANRDENSRLNKNKELFEVDPEIKTTSHLANEKSQSSEQLFSLLKENKQESSNNCYSADLSMRQAEGICEKATNLFSKHKSKLANEERKQAETNIEIGAAGNTMPNHDTEEDKSIFEINRYQQRLIGAIYKAKSVQEVVPNPNATNDVVVTAESLIKELNTLSYNIQTLTDNNDKIRKELRNRNVSIIEDELSTFMDLPGDLNDSID